MPTTRDDLTEALNVIRSQGWTQGELRRPDGKVCALGAVATAKNIKALPSSCCDDCQRAHEDRGGLDYPRSSDPCYKALNKAVSEIDSGLDILDYNDDHGRTQAEIEAVFERAIELA